jgi:hypothetical protein
VAAKDDLRKLIGGGQSQVKQNLSSFIGIGAPPATALSPQQGAQQAAAFAQQVASQPPGTPPQRPPAPAAVGGVPLSEIAAIPGVQAVRALSTTAAAENTAAGLGEVAGRVIGFAGGPAGSIAGGAVGAGAGLALQRLVTGQDVKPGEMALEMGLSVLPDAIARPVMGIGRALARTRPGIRAVEDKAARFFSNKAVEAFDPPDEIAVNQLFDLVRGTGAKLEPQALAKPLTAMTKKQFKQASQFLINMPAPPGKSSEAFGEGVVEALENIRNGTGAQIDIGTLQHIRSQIGKKIFDVKSNSAKDTLGSLKDAIDDAIEKGKFVGPVNPAPLLAEARGAFARMKQTEEFMTFIDSKVARQLKEGNAFSFNFGNLIQGLDKPTSKIEKRAFAALQKNPAARVAVKDFIKNMGTVTFRPNRALDSLPFSNAISTILLAGPVARGRFNMLVRQRGTFGMTIDETIVFANSIRRGAFNNDINREPRQ